MEAKRKPHSSAVKRAVPASRKPLSGAEKAPKLSSEILSKLSQMNSDKERNALLRSHLLLNAEVVLELNAATLKELRADTKNALALARSSHLCRLNDAQERIAGAMLPVRSQRAGSQRGKSSCDRTLWPVPSGSSRKPRMTKESRAH